MMNIIIRLFNQNRRLVIIVLAIIAFIFIVIPGLNKLEGERQKRQFKEEQANSVVLTEQEQNLPTESIIGAGTISIQKTKQNVSIIEKFVEKCNQKDIDGAYNMLTDECKQAIYKTKEAFENGYYKIMFSTRKLVDMEHFISSNNRYTYYVKYYDDILSTGNVQKAKHYNDYVTIDENSKNGKININNLIYTKDINKTKEVNGIKITVLTQEIYKENEKYQIKIENTTDKTVLIDTREKSYTMCLVADNGVKYNSNIAEIPVAQRRISAYDSKIYKIIYSKTYGIAAESRGIAFLDIVPDYKKFTQDKTNADERVQIVIEM